MPPIAPSWATSPFALLIIFVEDVQVSDLTDIGIDSTDT
jgi:hypothetical protein